MKQSIELFSEDTKLLKQEKKEKLVFPLISKILLGIMLTILVFAGVAIALIATLPDIPSDEETRLIIIVGFSSLGGVGILFAITLAIVFRERRKYNLETQICSLLLEHDFSFLDILSVAINSSKDKDFEDIAEAVSQVFAYQFESCALYEHFMKKEIEKCNSIGSLYRQNSWFGSNKLF